MALVVKHVPSFGYDGMGNVTVDNLSNSYSYDAEGRPITVNNGAQVIQTTFDPFGRATEQNRDGTYTQIVYSPSGAKFAFMNGTTVLGLKAPMAAGMAAVRASDGTGYFQHADWLGSSRFGSTGGGTVAYDRAYAPFGEVYAESGGTTNRDFTGQTEDTTPGIYDFLFRQQSQSQGRWLAPDPAGLAAVDITNPQIWNRYAYVGNQPLSAIDPLGLRKVLVCTWVGPEGDVHLSCTEVEAFDPSPPGDDDGRGGHVGPGPVNNGPPQPPNPPKKPNSPNYGAGLCAATPALQLRHYGGCSYVCEFVYDDPFDIRIGGMHATGPAIDAACGPGRFCPALVTVEKDNPGATEPVRIFSCVP